MYIKERIISLVFFALIVLLLTHIIAISKARKRIFALPVLMAILAAFYIPPTTADLYRLAPIVDQYEALSFLNFITTIPEHTLFTEHLLFFASSRLSIPNSISVIAASIFYSIVAYILYDYSKRKSISSKSEALALLFFLFLGQFIEVISGVRSMVALSMITLCLYREFFQGKSLFRNLPIYVLAAGLHTIAIPIITLRVLFLLLEREEKTTSWRRITRSLLCLALIAIGLKAGANLLNATISKATSYLSHEVYSYGWEYIIGFIQILITILLTKKDREANSSAALNSYKKFLRIIVAVCLIFCWEYSIFHRYTIFLTLAILPFLEETISSERHRFKDLVFSKRFLIILILILFNALLAFTRGNLCGYKMF